MPYWSSPQFFFGFAPPIWLCRTGVFLSFSLVLRHPSGYAVLEFSLTLFLRLTSLIWFCRTEVFLIFFRSLSYFSLVHLLSAGLSVFLLQSPLLIILGYTVEDCHHLSVPYHPNSTIKIRYSCSLLPLHAHPALHPARMTLLCGLCTYLLVFFPVDLHFLSM